MTVYFNKFRYNNNLGNLAVTGRDTKKCFLELIQNSQRIRKSINKVDMELARTRKNLMKTVLSF